jgi:hypothetical protein
VWYNHLAFGIDGDVGLLAKTQQMHSVVAMLRPVIVGIGAALARAYGKTIGSVFSLKHFFARRIGQVAMSRLVGIFVNEQGVSVGIRPAKQQ